MTPRYQVTTKVNKKVAATVESTQTWEKSFKNRFREKKNGSVNSTPKCQ